MDIYKKHIELLGCKAEDKVTGFKGVIECVSFDLYGCVQASLKPLMDKKGEMPDGHWFDVTRLNVSTGKKVMTVPDFYEGYVAEGKKGACDKPARRG